MSLIRHRCIVCDAPVPNQYAPSPCCEGYTCPKSSAPPPGVVVAAPHNEAMSELLKLAERLEQATGPDRELDAAIGWLKRPTSHPTFEAFAAEVTSDMPGAWNEPRYTASLDAAMQLVPEGMLWKVETWANGSSANVHKTRPFGDGKRYSAATPALALCAAALRARSAGEPA